MEEYDTTKPEEQEEFPLNPIDINDEESEDDEVKLNCIGGFRGLRDSDFSSDSEIEEVPEEDQRYDVKFVVGMQYISPIAHPSIKWFSLCCSDDGVVQFSNGVAAGDALVTTIIRPKAERLSPHPEEKPRPSADSKSDNHSDGETESGSETTSELPASRFLRQVEKLTDRFGALGSQRTLNNQPDSPNKAKRVLSSNTLASLNADARGRADSPKRIRTNLDPPSPIYDNFVNTSMATCNEDELDMTLLEELRSTERGGDNSPVPLLTPPQSPRTVPNEDDRPEWPSNLVVDSAMMTATATRPLSPVSLQQLEEAEESRLRDAFSHPSASSITPLLRSIYVGID